MELIITKSIIPDLLIIKSNIYPDERGFFKENFSIEDFIKNDIPVNFKQDNVSFSKKGTFRGLHYQIEPFSQGKLVTCLNGSVIDFIVDLRFDSETFLKYEAIELNSTNGLSLMIPSYCAHGFLATSDAILYYKVTNIYSPENARIINYKDSTINIDINSYIKNYNIETIIISSKDSSAPSWKKAEIF